MRWAEEWFDAWTEFHMQPIEFIEVSHEVVVVPLHQVATGKRSGVVVEIELTYVLEVRGGLITRFTSIRPSRRRLRSLRHSAGRPVRAVQSAALIPGGGILALMAEAGYKASKEQLLKRLSRIEGQVRGVRSMVDEERYCIDVLTQISAIRAALDKVALGLVDEHARNCMRESEGDPEAHVDELMSALGRMLQQ